MPFPRSNFGSQPSSQKHCERTMRKEAPRAIIYARFSTDRQNEKSVDDQIALCAARCAREGWEVVDSFSDRAVSGSTPVAKRVGGAKMLAALMAREADVLVLESLDRLSRDQVDQETIVRQLEFIGVRIVGLSDGYDSATGSSRKVLRAVRGLVNELYLDDLREKVKRGMRGVFERGCCPGGKVYGYRTEECEAGKRFVIYEPEARIVREIFTRFAAGWSAGRIVDDLNRRRILSPRGGKWMVSALVGVDSLGTGLLNNRLYVGLHIFGRFEWRKDPTTGKRTKRVRPESEWLRAEHPELRIVDEETWEGVRDRKRPTGHRTGGAPAKTLLSGILRCGLCGAPMIKSGRSSYCCSVSHNQGRSVCPGLSVSAEDAESAIIRVIQAQLLSPDAVERVLKSVRAQLETLTACSDEEEKEIQARMAALRAEIDNLVEAVAMGSLPAAVVGKKISERQAELDRLEDDLEGLKRADTLRVPDEELRELIRTQAAAMREAINSDVQVAREMLKKVIGAVTVLAGDDTVTLKMKNPALGRVFKLPELSEPRDTIVVAGEGFEPPTFGL